MPVGNAFNTQGTGSSGSTAPAQTPASGFLGGFDFNDIIAAAVVWNGYRKK
tara:strand:- start:1217 stop:1369 length:153 start_codon:yes stop_codon:yes gene_type:complete